MDTPALGEDWPLITRMLPTAWRELAREKGAIRHEKGITDPDVVLRVLLLHIAGGLSLRRTAARAMELGWADISDVAILKRLRNSEEWLRSLATGVFTSTRLGAEPVVLPAGRRFRAIDATTVQEPGSTGTDWRVHYSIQLPTLACDFYELTDAKGGETYTRFPITHGDVVLADRGYSHREGVAHVVAQGGDVIVRLNRSAFPLENEDGSACDLLANLRGMKGHEPGAWAVWFAAGKGKKAHRMRARVCAVRKSQASAEAAKARARKDASDKGHQIQPETLECAEYFFVLTTLAETDFPATRVLELYRARWQVELVFKRLKSFLQLGHVPKQNDDSARAWIEGKLLTALLASKLEEESFFSPWGFRLLSEMPAPRVP